MASSTGSLPPPSPLIPHDDFETTSGDRSTQQANTDASIDSRPLTTTHASTTEDKIDALKMIADSVAQQRQYASRAVMFHPSILAVFVVIVGLVYQFMYPRFRNNLGLVGTTSAGLIMSLLVSIRGLTGGYIAQAERIGTWKWLDKGREGEDGEGVVGDEDEVLVTRYGKEPIGALVLRGVRESTGAGTSSPKKKRTTSKTAPVLGQIRGFAVVNRYRRRGIGTELLEEAIKLCQEKGWSGPEFAVDHANSARVLPAMFNGPFLKREQDARKLLEKVRSELGATGVKKGKR